MFNNRISLPQMLGLGSRDPSVQVLLQGLDKLSLLPHLADTVDICGKASPQAQAAPAPVRDAEEKRALLASMICDHTGTADLEKLMTRLSRFPMNMIAKARDHGVIMHILKDKPQAGDLKPTDLGFGHDLDGNGKVEIGRWVDLNGDGKEDPGEREDLTPGGYSWNDVKGAYDTGSNTLFYKEEEANNESDYFNASVLHEFSHAVDDAFRNDKEAGEAWSQAINENYNAARQKEPGHKFVDGYAARDRAEYLAQSVAAFLTEKDIPDNPSNDEVSYFAPDNITRANLRAKDPAMYEFLARRLDQGRT